MVADKITTLIITDRHHAPFATFEQQMADLLSSKRRGTFLPQKMELGRLVTRGTGNRLSADLRRNSDGRLKFGFGRDTTMRITEIETNEMGQLAGPPRVRIDVAPIEF